MSLTLEVEHTFGWKWYIYLSHIVDEESCEEYEYKLVDTIIEELQITMEYFQNSITECGGHIDQYMRICYFETREQAQRCIDEYLDHCLLMVLLTKR
jgi:hypothetical protein